MSTMLLRGLIAAALVAAVIAAYMGWRNSVFADGDTAGAARITTQWNQDTIKRAAVAASATKAARTEERNAAAAAMEVEREGRINAEKLARQAQASAARSTAAAGGLLGNLAALDAAARGRGLPTAAACPGEFERERDAAISARAVLGSCVAEYQALGRDDDLAHDAVALKLDTALAYIRILNPPPTERKSP